MIVYIFLGSYQSKTVELEREKSIRVWDD